MAAIVLGLLLAVTPGSSRASGEGRPRVNIEDLEISCDTSDQTVTWSFNAVNRGDTPGNYDIKVRIRPKKGQEIELIYNDVDFNPGQSIPFGTTENVGIPVLKANVRGSSENNHNNNKKLNGSATDHAKCTP